MFKKHLPVIILLSIYAISWIVLIGIFTKESKNGNTEVKSFSSSEILALNEEEKNNKENEETVNQNNNKQELVLSSGEEEIVANNSKVSQAEAKAKPTKITEIKKAEPKGTIAIKEPTVVTNNYKGYETIGKIEAPSIGLDLPILKYQSVAGMEIAPCLVYSKGEFNKSGLMYITGHNYRNGKLFSNNNNLKLGDTITVTLLDGSKRSYKVTDKFTTSPSDVSYLKEEADGSPKVILQSCTDDERSRIIIIAK